jgi:polysaccharide export outer membrane protein
MLKPENGTYTHDLEYARYLAEKNYRIQVGDKLEIRVYTNEGERIIDPDYELQKDLNTNTIRKEESIYLVKKDGRMKIPMIGDISLEGMTLSEAEDILQNEFGEFYKDPYIILEFVNKRVVVLGMEGGHVVPLENENMNLLEVLALAGGIPEDMKVRNIRIIRGDLNNPDVQIVDLTTIQGMQSADLNIYSGDIIYVEPVVRVFSESTRELIPLISIITSFVALILAIQRF